MKFKLCELLGIEYPIIAGGMTEVSTPELVAAVSNAGGLGVLGTGSFAENPEIARKKIRQCMALTAKPFGVNISLAMSSADRMIKICCEEGVKAITTGAGSPEPYLTMCKAACIKVIPVVSSTVQAKKMAAAGADAIVAEGLESGGVTGKMTTMPLIPAVCDLTDIPVIAAGGIVDGRGMAAAIALGACGIQMGTRFLLSSESPICDKAKDFLLSKNGSETFAPGEKIGAKIKPRIVMCPGAQKVANLESDSNTTLADFVTYATQEKVNMGFFDGNLEDGYTSAGMGLGAIHEILTCKEIIEHTMRQFDEIRTKLAE